MPTSDVDHPEEVAIRRWLCALLLLGVGWRVLRYGLCFPFWGDEAYLNISILRRDYAGLMEPLHYFQVAPVLYLWIQRTAFNLFGGGEYALRAWSLIAGVASLLLVWRIARAQMEALAANIAVGVSACSYYLVRHTCESKPYAGDLLVATLLIYLAMRWRQARPGVKWPLVCGVVAAASLWLSYPAVFVCVGVSVAALPAAIRAGKPRAWLGWGVYNALVMVSFLAFFWVIEADTVSRSAGSWLEAYWRDAFPPHNGIGSLLAWLAKIHCGRMFAYPHGGTGYGSILTTACFAVGAVVLVVRRRAWLVLLFAGMAAPALVAAWLHRYPYGGSVRVSIYFAPVICMVAAVGVTAVTGWISLRPARDCARGLVGVVLVGIALLGMTKDVIMRCKSPEDLYKRSAMRAVTAQFAPGDIVAIVNPEEGAPAPPVGPKFDQVLRYYLELEHDVPPVFVLDQLPSATAWILRFEGPAGGPPDELVTSLANAAGLRAESTQQHALSTRWTSELTLYHSTPTTSTP